MYYSVNVSCRREIPRDENRDFEISATLFSRADFAKIRDFREISEKIIKNIRKCAHFVIRIIGFRRGKTGNFWKNFEFLCSSRFWKIVFFWVFFVPFSHRKAFFRWFYRKSQIWLFRVFSRFLKKCFL